MKFLSLSFTDSQAPLPIAHHPLLCPLQGGSTVKAINKGVPGGPLICRSPLFSMQIIYIFFAEVYSIQSVEGIVSSPKLKIMSMALK